MGFPRQECWSGLPFPSQRLFPAQGLNLGLLYCSLLPSPPPPSFSLFFFLPSQKKGVLLINVQENWGGGNCFAERECGSIQGLWLWDQALSLCCLMMASFLGRIFLHFQANGPSHSRLFSLLTLLPHKEKVPLFSYVQQMSGCWCCLMNKSCLGNMSIPAEGVSRVVVFSPVTPESLVHSGGTRVVWSTLFEPHGVIKGVYPKKDRGVVTWTRGSG